MPVNQEMLEKVKVALNEIAEKIKNITAWTPRSTIQLITEVVKEVEKLSVVLPMSSSDKLDLAAKVADDYIKLPFYVELFDRPIFRILIEAVVNTLNKYTGKNWLEKIESKEIVS